MKKNTKKSMNLNSKIKTILILVVITFISVFLLNFIKQKSEPALVKSIDDSSLEVYNASDLQQYDGTDPNKPILIGLNGYVYDVSEGREYYKIGGSYHFLAGKDSSKELNMIGGEIIKKKYPIVGILK